MNPPNDLQILLVDDHKIVREGIAGLVHSIRPNSEIVQCASYPEAMDALKSHPSIRLIITDLDLGETTGRDLCITTRKYHPELPILVLSMHTEKGMILELQRCGANGYLSKTCSREELESGIECALSGKRFYSTEVLESLSQESAPSEKSSTLLKHLSHREIEIMTLIAKGHSSREIGEQLHISPRTVDTHRNNIIKKLEVSNSAGLIKLAVKSGLVD